MANRSFDITVEKLWRFQRIFCVIIMALMLISCFLGVFGVPFDDDSKTFFDSVDRESREEFNDGVFVKYDTASSAAAAVKSIILFSASSAVRNDIYYEVAEAEHMSVSQNADGIAYLTVEGFDSDLTVGIYHVIMLFFAVSTPILLGVAITVILIKYRTPARKRSSHLIYKRTMNWVRIIVCHMSLMFLIPVIASKVRLGIGGWALVFLITVMIAVNFVASRLKDLTDIQKKYRKMLHFTSIVGVLIFAVFCISLIMSGAVPKVIELFGGKTFPDILDYFKGGNFDIDEIIHLVAGIMFMAGLFATRRSLGNNLCRLGLVTTRMKKRDYSSGDAYITSTIAPNLMLLVYWLLIGSKAELIFYKEEAVFFIIAMVCVAAMTGVEILITVFKATVCIDLGSGGRDTVLEGSTYSAETEQHLSEQIVTYTDKRAKKEHKDKK